MDSVTSFTPAPPERAPRPPIARPLTEGPRWYRARIRGWGPFLALVPPGIAGTIAYLSLRYSDTAWSGAVGLLGAMLAAPGLLVVGAPFGNRDLYLLAMLASGLMWMLIGWVAARRATRNPFATWGSFWQHFGWMLVGIWAGVFVALAIATYSLGDSLL